MTISALPLACGDDEEDGGGKGGGTSTGGSKATGGSAGTGTGGKATGGTGTGGKATGGTGTGGKATGGTGTGGTTSTGGTMPGGAGGEGGAMGGEGGGPQMTICEQFCTEGEVADCSHTFANCVAACEDVYTYGRTMGDPGCEDLLDAYFQCAIDGTGNASDWACNQNQPSYTGAECVDESGAAIASYCFP